ncbi:MAG: hypothetical protein ACRDL4_09695, partial [Thermoleophilaceae bacterium]
MRTVRAALQALRDANLARVGCDTALGDAEQDVLTAEAAEQQATERRDRARVEAREELAAWGSRHRPTLADLGVTGCLEPLGAV